MQEQKTHCGKITEHNFTTSPTIRVQILSNFYVDSDVKAKGRQCREEIGVVQNFNSLPAKLLPSLFEVAGVLILHNTKKLATHQSLCNFARDVTFDTDWKL